MAVKSSIGKGGGGKHRGVKIVLTACAVVVVAAAMQAGFVQRAVAAVSPGPAPAATAPASTGVLPGSFAGLVKKVTPAVVNVATTGEVPAQEATQNPFPPGSPFHEFFKHYFEGQPGNGQGEPMEKIHALGSGFIIDPSGYVVTNNHVIDSADKITVILNDGKRYPAKVVGADKKTDLALLKIDAGHPLPYVSFGDSSKAEVGDWVVAIGNPFGLGGTVTAGIVSARGRDIHSGPYDSFLQIDAPINRGNSGGPLFNEKGQVIGINSAIYTPNGGSVGIGFAIPSDQAQPVLAQLREHGYVARGWLGVEVQPVTADVADSLGLKGNEGALVASVMPNSPAAKAGVHPGDVITSYNGHPITQLKDLPQLVARTKAGEQVPMKVWRQGHETDLQVAIASSPQEKQQEQASVQPGSTEQGTTSQSADKLGLALTNLTPAVRGRYGIPQDEHGVLVVGVQNDGPGARQGLRAGDVIQMVGQKEVTSSKQVAQAVDQAAEAKRKSVLLLVKRGDQSRFIAVPFGQA
jgi:serine protease Do